jgi:O-antigen/teichoic acid export membrane protein
LISHSFLYLIVRVGNGLLAMTTLAAFTRLLSPEEYGIYALGVAIATVFSGVLFEWLNVTVGRFYPIQLYDPRKVTDVAAVAFWFATAVAALLYIGALPYREFFGLDPVIVGILFLSTVVLSCYTLALQVANSESRPLRYGMLSWAKGVGVLLVGFFFIHHEYGGRGALMGYLSGLAFAVIVFAPRSLLRVNFRRVDKRLAEKMFRYGLPLSFNHLAIAIVDVADRLMIGSLLGIVHVAPYAVAYDLVQQFVGPIMNVLFIAALPVIVRVFEAAQADHTNIQLHALGSRLVGIGLPAAAGVGVLASDISEIIFGIEYRHDAATIMPWLAAAIFVGAFKSYFLDLVFHLRRTSKYQGYIAILMAVVNIVLNLILLPRYGVVAAAWTTLGAFAVGALASWIVGSFLFTLPRLGNVFLSSASASVIMIVVLYLLPSSSGFIWLTAKLAVGIVTYALMAWAFNVAGCRRR